MDQGFGFFFWKEASNHIFFKTIFNTFYKHFLTSIFNMISALETV